MCKRQFNRCGVIVSGSMLMKRFLPIMTLLDEVVYDTTKNSPITKMPRRKVCLPIDGSENSTNAVNFFIKKLLQKDDKVYLLNCRQPLDEINLPSFYQSKEMFEANKKKSHDLLMKTAGLFEELNVDVDVVAISLRGETRATLDAAIDSLECDFVVVGAHSRKGVSFLMGSISNHLMHHLKVPVIVVK